MELRRLIDTLQAGLLSFPVTDFAADGGFAPEPYARRIDWLVSHRPTALFAAGGTGEFFSLSRAEHAAVVATAVEAAGGRLPIVGSAGGILADAVEQARAVERAGAQGILLFPHYLVDACAEGMLAYAKAVCDAVGIGVIVYNRGDFRLDAGTLCRLAESCPNFIGVKDATGDLELIAAIRGALGERVAYFGGLPTAELFASAYRAAGVPTYSSAVFNFIPRTALAFFDALVAGESKTLDRLLRDFFLPFVALRNRRKGYAVAIVKAGVRLRGMPAGAVRPPLVDLTAAEEAELVRLIEAQQLN
ncbi:MAG: 5-dehydro-4-deoxyglucarate dehydratase [Reyranellaceae bacterium]